jgi:hypothetical protein
MILGRHHTLPPSDACETSAEGLCVKAERVGFCGGPGSKRRRASVPPAVGMSARLVFALVVAGLTTVSGSWNGSQAWAGCGNYIQFRGTHLAYGGMVTTAEVSTVTSGAHPRPDRLPWFSTTFSQLLGRRPDAPVDSRRTPCQGPACRQQPVSPPIPASVFVGLFSQDALMFAERVAEPPTSGWRVAAAFSLPPSPRPAVIFRPPR